MMRIGHDGLRPHIEALRPWNEAQEVLGFQKHFVPQKILIIQHAGADVGYLKLVHHPEATDIEGFYLAATVRGQGLGERILNDLLAVFAADGKAVTLRVLKSNPAQRLYHRLGFEIIDEQGDSYAMCYQRRDIE